MYNESSSRAAAALGRLGAKERRLVARPVTKHAVDQNIANDKEAHLRVVANDIRIKARLSDRSSGKVSTDPRSDSIADRDIFLAIQRSVAAGASVRFTSTKTPLVTHLHSPMHQANWTQMEKADRREKKKHLTYDTWIKTFWLPHPDHSGDMLKALSWGCAMPSSSRALTLHLGPEVIEAAHKDQAGFVRHIHRRMARELKKAFVSIEGAEVPEFFFCVEDTDVGTAHAHGAIFYDETIPGITEVVRGALKRAGGDSRQKASGRQLDMRRLETAPRWVNYLAKWQLGSSLHHNGKSFAATHGIRRLGRAWYIKARSGAVVLDPQKSWSDFGLTPLTEAP